MTTIPTSTPAPYVELLRAATAIDQATRAGIPVAKQLQLVESNPSLPPQTKEAPLQLIKMLLQKTLGAKPATAAVAQLTEALSTRHDVEPKRLKYLVDDKPPTVPLVAEAHSARQPEATKQLSPDAEGTPTALLRELSEYISYDIRYPRRGPYNALPLSNDEGHLWQRLCEASAALQTRGISSAPSAAGGQTPEQLLIEVVRELRQDAELNGSAHTDSPYGRFGGVDVFTRMWKARASG